MAESPATLVTGVAGFIGSALARQLLENGERVVGIDSLHTGRRDNVPEGVEFIEADLRFAETIAVLADRSFNAIFHLAGQSGGEPSYDDPVFDLQANVQSTLLLLQHLRKTKSGPFIYASSVSIYGDQSRDGLPLSETLSPSPKSLYGVGKMASEQYISLYARQFGIDGVALRLFNIYGPGQDLGNMRQGMISIYLSQALSDRHIHVRGAGDRYRDFVYIDDAVEAFLLARKCASGFQVFNVCSGSATRVDEVIDHIGNALPYEITTEYRGSTPGDVHGWVGDPRCFMTETGWRPRVAVEEGIAHMSHWARNHPFGARQ